MYSSSSFNTCAALASLLLSSSLAHAQEAPSSGSNMLTNLLDDNSTISTPTTQKQPPSSNARLLRILPLGASITQGQGSSHGNGYRQTLRNYLRSVGWDVNMVGNRTHGTMRDNNVSAIPGITISQVHDLAIDSLKFQPNLVLINAGTNDCVQELDIENAPQRIESLLNELFVGIPGVTVLLSTLLPSTNEGVVKHQPGYNKALRDIVKSRSSRGERIVLADMDTGVIRASDLPDWIHPTDDGYVALAEIWYGAFERARGMLQIASPTGFEDKIEDDW